ncbi:hypothetical protein QTP88_012877 [Uroleucon formosanum]
MNVPGLDPPLLSMPGLCQVFYYPLMTVEALTVDTSSRGRGVGVCITSTQFKTTRKWKAVIFISSIYRSTCIYVSIILVISVI